MTSLRIVALAILLSQTAASAPQLRAGGNLGRLHPTADILAANAETQYTNHWDRLRHGTLSLIQLQGWIPTALVAAELHQSQNKQLAMVAAKLGHSHEQSPPPARAATGGEEPPMSPLQALISILIYIALVGLIALWWHSRDLPQVDPALTSDGLEEWKFGFCFCWEDPLVCFCSCCCPAIRWAETMSFVKDAFRFWPAFFMYICLMAFARFELTAMICFIVLACVCTSYRQEMRRKFNMERQGGFSYATDCLLYAFFPCCAIQQEARQVNEAMKIAVGHPAVALPQDRKRTCNVS